MRNYATQMEVVRKGIVTRELKIVAEKQMLQKVFVKIENQNTRTLVPCAVSFVQFVA